MGARAEVCERAPVEWEATVIPRGFKLVVDTREKYPLFEGRGDVPTVSRVLKHGDYAIDGHEKAAAVERKRISDLCGYIVSYRKETRPKLEALAAMEWAALVVEAEEAEMVTRFMYSKITPEHIRGFFTALRTDYGIHVFVSGKRDDIERYVLDHLTRVYRNLRRRK